MPIIHVMPSWDMASRHAIVVPEGEDVDLLVYRTSIRVEALRSDGCWMYTSNPRDLDGFSIFIHEGGEVPEISPSDVVIRIRFVNTAAEAGWQANKARLVFLKKSVEIVVSSAFRLSPRESVDIPDLEAQDNYLRALCRGRPGLSLFWDAYDFGFSLICKIKELQNKLFLLEFSDKDSDRFTLDDSSLNRLSLDILCARDEAAKEIRGLEQRKGNLRVDGELLGFLPSSAFSFDVETQYFKRLFVEEILKEFEAAFSVKSRIENARLGFITVSVKSPQPLPPEAIIRLFAALHFSSFCSLGEEEEYKLKASRGRLFKQA